MIPERPHAIEGLFVAAPFGLGVLDADLRWREVNDAMGEMGLAGVPAVVELARTARASGETARDAVCHLKRWFDVAAFPVDDGVGLAAVEITDRVQAERELSESHRRDALVARATELLGTALDVRQTAELVASLAVPEIAEWCVVELVRDDTVQRIAYTHADRAKVALIEEFDRRYPIDASSPTTGVLRSGEPELVPEIPPAMLEATSDRELARMLDELGFRSTLVVPLIARGRILGDLALATGDRRRLGPQELELARLLADRAALALDTAALYAQREAVAVSLQEELLPPRLPSIPGLDVAARYSAAGEGNEVGGDFYDVFASGSGWQVVIGDVVGKGPAAAAITGLARATLRAASAYEGAPSGLLRVLNEALLAEDRGNRIASVACVRLDPEPDGLKLTTSVAGHLPPLVAGRDGTVRPLGRHGALLGVEDDLVVFNTVDHLRAGELLVLYTDGVVEARGEHGVFGERQLAALLGGLSGEAPSRALARIEAAVLATSEGRPRDDMALIGLRVRQSA